MIELTFPNPIVCDVLDKKSIKKFQAVYAELKPYYADDSENSVRTTIQSIAWYDSIYRTFNQGLKWTWKNKKQENLPGTIIEYMHIGYLNHVLINLRKLYEPKRRGPRQVNSLPTIIKKIAAHIGLFTRENYVCYDGSPYEISNNAKVDLRHKVFDNLCGIKSIAERNRNNKLQKKIIDKLSEKVRLNKYIDIYVNQFMAHASSNKSEDEMKKAFSSVTLMKIQSQTRNAIWAINQIGKILDELIVTEVPSPQFDPMKNWENSIFDSRSKSALKNYWEDRMNWWRRWADKYWDSDYYFISPQKGIKLADK